MWASPQFGQMFATCSEDRCVGVWSIADSGDEVSWVNRCKIRDFKRGVTDLRFSPKQYGLYLATGCEDGYVRMYQLQDALEFHSWRLTEQFSLLLPGPSNSSGIASADVGLVGCVALDWLDGADDVMSLAVLGRNGVLYIWARSKKPCEMMMDCVCVTYGTTSLYMSMLFYYTHTHIVLLHTHTHEHTIHVRRELHTHTHAYLVFLYHAHNIVRAHITCAQMYEYTNMCTDVLMHRTRHGSFCRRATR
eukprot:GHVS01006959.1.p1 GENE.GHVS01006959.1~~GHVS01006959.1.p1  ORF type:complete len:248 (+),score=14.59 GHVS01006959.1:451-1194(+)